MLLLSLVAVGLALTVSLSRNANLNAQNRSLKFETGHFEVADKEAFHFRALHTRGRHWLFRAYLPDDAEFEYGIGQLNMSFDRKIDFGQSTTMKDF